MTRVVDFDFGLESASVPTTPSPQVAGDLVTKGFADNNYVQGAQALDNIAALKAVTAANRKDKDLRYVKDVNQVFAFHSDSSADGNDVNVIAPNAGSGRWILTTSAATGSGLKNYIENPDAEQSVIDWDLTTAGSNDITRHTATPLAGDASFTYESDGTNNATIESNVLAVDRAYRDNLLGVTAVLEITNSSGDRDNWKVGIYNKTDSKWADATLVEDMPPGAIFQYVSAFVPRPGKDYVFRIEEDDAANGDTIKWDDVRIGPDPTNVIPLASAEGPGLVFEPELGSNSNGYYLKHPNGLLECWFVQTFTGTVNTASGNNFISSIITWTFPHAFISDPVNSEGRPLVTASPGPNSRTSWVISEDASVSFTSTSYRLCRSTTSSSSTYRTSLYARGFWK